MVHKNSSNSNDELCRSSSSPAASCCCCLLVLTVLLGLISGISSQQQASLGVAGVFPCKQAGQFFDISTLECRACNQSAGYVPAADKLSCVLCDASSGNQTSFANGFSMTTAWQPATLSAAGTCQCASAAAGTVVSTVSDAGRDLQRCLVCPADTTADASTGACTPPSGPLSSPAKDLAYVLSSMNANGAGILAATATQALIQDVLEPSGRMRAYTIAQSWPLANLLGPAARACINAGNREGCNAVANLCALQMYSSEAASCQIYEELLAAVPGSVSRRVSVSSNAFPRPSTAPLPWLYYLPGSPYLTTDEVYLEVSLSASAPALQFVLASYDINGTWLGLHNWTLQLQACGGYAREAALWTRFGVDYSSSCSIDLVSLLSQLDYTSNGPRFYDPYIMQDSGLLYPIPVKLLNKAEQFSSDEMPVGHVRRFFFIDTTLSRSTAGGSDGAPQAVVFPSRLDLLVQIQPDARSKIRPPLLTIKYSAMSTDPQTPSMPASFSVTYTNPPELTDAFWYAWQTILIVLLIVLGGPWWVWRVVLYIRKKANAPMDLELLLCGLLAAIDVLSAVLVMVLLVVSVYWLVLYKLQEGVLLLMLPDDQLYNFWVTVVLAMVGQSVGLLQMLYQQISVDIFFLDWEKPRRILARGGGREEPGPVSAWRTLLVANEWNELQTLRFTCPTFTLLTAVFILQGAGMQAAAYIHPNQDDFSTYQNVPQSLLLRFAIAAVWFLLLGLAQILWKVLLVHRFAGHPFNSFIDLLFLANTSAVVMDERHSGYYLHGRNQMHHSDTTLAELNSSLVREEEGLVACRGLVATYTGGTMGQGRTAAELNDNQVFLLHVSPELRRSYESMLLSQIEQAAEEQRANKGVVTTAVQGPTRPKSSSINTSGVYAEMFKSAIDEVERNHATQVVISSYWQRLLRLPPAAAASMTLLQHDFHNSFASTLFFGQELRLYVFEALLFSSLHMSLGNAAAAGFITLIVQQVLVWVRQHFGQNNLARKTLVDSHFLI